MVGNSSATFNGGSLEGRLDLQQKSIVSLRGTSHTLSSSFNRISGDSSVVMDGSSSIQGNVDLEDFSKLVLDSGGTIDGYLDCSSGGDASCAVPGDVSGGSNCGQCQP
jgi:hypothetical protein